QNPRRRRAGKVQWWRAIGSDQKQKIVELAYGTRILCRALQERKKTDDFGLWLRRVDGSERSCPSRSRIDAESEISGRRTDVKAKIKSNIERCYALLNPEIVYGTCNA